MKVYSSSRDYFPLTHLTLLILIHIRVGTKSDLNLQFIIEKVGSVHDALKKIHFKVSLIIYLSGGIKSKTTTLTLNV
jgi:hypothetical protein